MRLKHAVEKKLLQGLGSPLKAQGIHRRSYLVRGIPTHRKTLGWPPTDASYLAMKGLLPRMVAVLVSLAGAVLVFVSAVVVQGQLGQAAAAVVVRRLNRVGG